MEEIYKLFGSRPWTMPLSDLWSLLTRFAEQRNIFFSVSEIAIGMRFNSVVLSLAKIYFLRGGKRLFSESGIKKEIILSCDMDGFMDEIKRTKPC